MSRYLYYVDCFGLVSTCSTLAGAKREAKRLAESFGGDDVEVVIDVFKLVRRHVRPGRKLP